MKLCRIKSITCFTLPVAVFGLDAASYTVNEDSNLVVAVHLLENELAVPVLLQVKSFDISAS